MRSRFCKLAPLLPFMFVTQQATAFGGLPALPSTLFVPRQWILRISNNDDEGCFSEIEAMGGDPFFLDSDDGTTANSSDDSKYDSLSSTAKSTKGGTMAPTRTRPSNSYVEVTKSTIDPVQMAELEAIGGDPFFLSDEDIKESFDTERVDEDPSNTAFILSQMAAMSASSGGGAASFLKKLEQRSSSSSSSLPEMDDDDLSSQFDKMTMAKPNWDDDNEVDEILALGGDPFFLSESDGSLTNNESEDEAYDEMLELGGDPFFLQDKSVAPSNAGAMKANVSSKKIDATPEKIGTDPEEKIISPMELLSQISALSAASPNLSGGAMGTLQQLGESNLGGHSDNDNNDQPDLWEEIESMGGDPSFLDLSETQENGRDSPPSESRRRPQITSARWMGSRYVTDGKGPTPQIVENTKALEDENWEWDGFVDENAHLDMM